jgi:tight adherence protein B
VITALLAGLACAVLLSRPVRRGGAAALPLGLLPLPLGAVAALAGPAAGLVVAVVTWAAVRAWRGRARASAAAAERAGAVEAVAVLASELRAGRGPGDALRAASSVAVGPFAAALSSAARALPGGAGPAGVLRSGAAESSAADALRGLAACLQVCAGSGGSLALASDTVAEALRAEEEQRLALETELAGPRATAAMLALLPLAGVLLAAGLGARPLHVLLHTLVGSGCLVLGVGLDLLGVWWTRRLVDRALR